MHQEFGLSKLQQCGRSILLAFILFPLLHLSACLLCVRVLKWLAEPRHRTLLAGLMFLAGQQQPCTAGKPLKEHSCRAVRRAGQQSSMPAPGLFALVTFYQQSSTSQHFQAWTLASQWSSSTWWQQRKRFLEEDRLEKSLQCPTLINTAHFSAGDWKIFKPLRSGRILHFVC